MKSEQLKKAIRPIIRRLRKWDVPAMSANVVENAWNRLDVAEARLAELGWKLCENCDGYGSTQVKVVAMKDGVPVLDKNGRPQLVLTEPPCAACNAKGVAPCRTSS